MMKLFMLVAIALFATETLSADQMIYDVVRQGDTVTDVGVVLKQEGGKALLEISLLTLGQGAEYRRWHPERPFLLFGSERVVPMKLSRFYSGKPSVARGAATIVFAAIGSQYERSATRAESRPGETCDEEADSSGAVERGGASEAVDRAGMAAGMGLLASNAKGEIAGTRATFDVTGKEGLLSQKIRLRFEVANESKRLRHDVTVPLVFNPLPQEKEPPVINLHGDSQGRPDNLLGQILPVIASQDVDIQGQIDESVSSGEVIVLSDTP